jgi:hypothetical protein
MTLAEEAQRYLAAVDFFRAQGCEPHWRPEPQPAGSPNRRRAAVAPQSPVRRKRCNY